MEMRGWEDESDLDSDSFIEEGPTRSLFSKVIALASAAALAFGGYTLAANIGLGSNQSLEFGQGIQVTAACDPNINIVPTAKYRNEVPVPDHYVDSILISNVSRECTDKLMILKAYPETSTSLGINSVAPKRIARFHMGSNGWAVDMEGCVTVMEGVHGTAEQNSVNLSTNGCSFSYNLQNSAWVPLKSWQTYRLTLETRPNQMVKINTTSNLGNNSLGWVLDTGEEVETSYMTNANSYPLWLDLSRTGRFNIYIKLSDADFTNSAVGPNLYTYSGGSGITCNYSRKVEANSIIPSGIYANFHTPGIRAAEFECVATQTGSLTFS